MDQFIYLEFLQLSHSQTFRRLPLRHLKTILGSSELNLDREGQVLDTVVQLIKDEPEKRSELVQLMECVRLDDLENKELKALAMNKELISREDGSCFDQILEAVKRRMIPEEEDSEMSAEERMQKRPRTNKTGGLLVLCDTSGKGDGFVI